MLENFRKYTGLMLVVLILLFLGLVFLMDGGGSRGYGSGPVVVTSHGRAYPQQEFERVSQNPIRMLQDLASQQSNIQGMLTISRYLNNLAVAPDSAGLDARRFLVNRVNLQNAAREFGIHASQEDVEELIQKSIFADRNGNFDVERYSRYVKRDLPRLGMSVQDMNDLLGELVIIDKLQEVLGSGLQASREMVRASTADRQQRVTYEIVAFPRTRFEAAQAPTDEEIKTYWEEHKGRYLSDAQRRISYVLAAPDYAALAEKLEKERPAPPEETSAPVEGTTPPVEGTTPPPEETPAPVEGTTPPSASQPGTEPAPEPSNDDAPNPAGAEEDSGPSCGQDEDAPPPEETEAPVEDAPPLPPTPGAAITPADSANPITPADPAKTITPVDPGITTTPPVAIPPLTDIPTPAPLSDPANPAAAFSEQEKEGAIKDLGIKMDDLWTRIYDNDGGQFEEFAKEAGFEWKTTELYTRETAPDELKVPLRDEPGKLAVDATFERDKGTTPADALSDIRRVGDDQWFLFRIDEAIEPKELTFEEAKDEVRSDLVGERALEAMTAAAEKAHAAVTEAMKAGKSFQDAAKEANLTFLRREDATLDKAIPGEPLAEDVFNLATKVNPGELSEIVTQADPNAPIQRSLFVHVEKRELVDSPAYQSILEQGYRRAGDTLRQLALQNWFAQQYAAAGVTLPAP